MSSFVVESDAANTIGMHIDALVDKILNMPTIYGYGAFFTCSLVFAFVLLNCSDKRNTVAAKASSNESVTKMRSSNPPLQQKQRTERNNSSGNEPEPRWYILQRLNYIFVIGFVISIMLFANNATSYINEPSTLLMFLIGWGTFLSYFFGFFGISFVDTDDIVVQQDLHASAVMSSPKRINKNPNPSSSARRNSALNKGCGLPEKNVVSQSQEVKALEDEEIAELVVCNRLKDHLLEKVLNPERAVRVRRLAFESKLKCKGALADLPFEHSLDYSKVFGANCEIVVGYVPLPVGIVGPLTLNDEEVYIPMATTEGCLVASTNRGCKAISAGAGARSALLQDGITRAPCLRMRSAMDAAQLKVWCDQEDNFRLLKNAFESTTSFGKLLSANPTVAGRNVYLRLKCFSGDAMGMNMVSKGSLAVVELLREQFPTLTLVALSGNMCTDKKAAATNWIEGRGKSIVVEAIIHRDTVQSILKTDVSTIVSTNIQKNLVGSAMAGVIGGFNAHASNMVTAIFLATGQDPAQNVESSNCITLMEHTAEGDLWISCTMPSIEVGTVGGGTTLPAQSSCLKVLGVHGGGQTPGANAAQLAHVVAATTMAGELSLIAALASNTLVQAHMKHNRKSPPK